MLLTVGWFLEHLVERTKKVGLKSKASLQKRFIFILIQCVLIGLSNILNINFSSETFNSIQFKKTLLNPDYTDS